MSTVEQFPVRANVGLSEYEALRAAGPALLEAIPGAVYLVDAEGRLVSYNGEAARLWGQSPDLHSDVLFCGSYKLFLDGRPLPHAHCPMAAAVMRGTETRNAEVVIERPDGTRITVLVNIRVLRGRSGEIQGAINCFQDISKRKKIEQELIERNSDLEDFFENGAVGLHIVDSEGVIRRANKAELDLLGYEANEYIGRHIGEFHADDETINDILMHLSSGRGINQCPARLKAKDGSIKHVLITSNGRFNEGKFVYTRCFTIDVTAQRAAEAARRESDERLAATYEAAPVAISEADENGRLTRVNDALCKMIGRPREQLLAMTFLDYTHEDDREADAAQYARQVRGEIDSYSARKRARRPDGSVVYLDLFSSTVRDQAGRFRYGVRVLQDVTEAKLMEDRVRASERRMRDLLDALPAAVYTTDSQGRITFFNKASVEMAGRVPQPGDEWCVTWRLYWPDGTPLPHDQCPLAIALRENRIVRGAEAIAERPDGTRVPFIPYPTPLHDANGNLIGAINMLVDISERKEAEIRQKVLIDELNHRVKNTLATVQSLAGQTARHSDGMQDFVSRFEMRLMALARAHDLLTQRHWREAPLEALVRELARPMAADSTHQITIEGPPVALNPRAALSMTMVLSELTTNAAKYGSLSSDNGSVLISWNTQEREGRAVLLLDWEERGGPPVAPPTRRGFGTRLITRCIERDLDGEVDLSFQPTGVRCRLEIPTARIRPA